MMPARALAPYDWDGVLTLIRTAFAAMEGRIDPPSSMHRLTPHDIATQAEQGEVWVIGPPVACCFLMPQGGMLGIGKLAVHPDWRRQGLARQLIAVAQTRAQALGLGALTVQTRIELVENHATFRSMGFEQTGATSHPGYDRPTSLTFRKRLPGPV